MLLAVLIATLLLGAVALQGQTYKILYAFTAGADGKVPEAGLTMDAAGNLYGTTDFGGHLDVICREVGCGTVFKLTNANSIWAFSTLYAFRGDSDGITPDARVILGPDGALYGTTYLGGRVPRSAREGSYGTVYRVGPPAAPCASSACQWEETVLYRFTGGADGSRPFSGDLVFDVAGDIFGSTSEGGANGCGDGCGVVFELTPSGTSWAESVLYAFKGGPDGDEPSSGVIFDQAGNLYGETAYCGGHDCYGLVYKLSHSGPGWVKTVLHRFGLNDLEYPTGGVVFDSSSNLYGVVCCPPAGGAFQLTLSNNGWIINWLAAFVGSYGPVNGAHLVMDRAGNLYGTTFGGGAYRQGNVFKLSPGIDGWTYTDLHDFHRTDGSGPSASVILDADGNIYGTTTEGGNLSACPIIGCGVVFEITP